MLSLMIRAKGRASISNALFSTRGEVLKLNNKVAIVTGAASGFGEGIARRFAAEGASVVVADIDAEGAARVAKDIGGDRTALPLAVDVSSNSEVKSMIAAALDSFGGLDILVNNAGVTHKNGPMLEVDEATFDHIYAVNVKSIYLSALHAVPVFRRQKHGVMVNITSTAGVRPRPGLTWYNGSKGAAITLTKSMAVELAPDNIRVNGINPDFIGLARSCGCHALRIDSAQSLTAAVRGALQADVPTLIEIREQDPWLR